MNELVNKYAHYFRKLRRDRNVQLGAAPHKPILLLSIIQLIQKSEITCHRIYITPELVMAFKDNWTKLVITSHSPNFALPFFHLRSEPFWKLIPKPGLEIPVSSSGSIRSFKSLRDTIECAEIDHELFHLLSDTVSSTYLEMVLLDTYFENTKAIYQPAPHAYALEAELEKQIAEESPAEYLSRIQEQEQSLNRELLAEAEYVRDGFFKKIIPRIYHFQCAISRWRLESTSTVQMIDACHIVPFSTSHNCHVTNGIALSPNLHRAFDRHLITINDDYTVNVSSSVTENDSPFNICQFHGQRILLPDDKKHWPSVDNLRRHREKR